MSHEEQRAAEQLDQVIAARQAGRLMDQANLASSPNLQFVDRLIDSTRATRIDAAFAAKLEGELNRLHPQSRAAAAPSVQQRWDAWLSAVALRSSRSAGMAVAASVIIAVLSFAIFRVMHTDSASSGFATQAPSIANVTPSATPADVPEAASDQPLPTVDASAVRPEPTSAAVVVPQRATPTPIPTRLAASPTHTSAGATPKPSPALTTTSRVKIVMLDMNGGGTGKHIGCGDTVVFVDRDIAPSSAPLSAAIRELLSVHEQYYGLSGLYNALYSSNLTLSSASIVSGHATINLNGALRTGGVCDIPRVEAQFEETALQFSTVKSVSTYINGVEIHQALSQK